MVRRVMPEMEARANANHFPKRSKPCSSVSRRTAVVLAGSAILVAGGFAATRIALSQQQPASKFDFESRRRDLLAHLNAVIQFYRASTAPIQKVGEPNDIVYRDQGAILATQTAQFAFQSAKAEAALMTEYQRHEGVAVEPSVPVEQQKLQATETNTELQINDLKARETTLDRQIASARPKDQPVLEAQRKQLEASLDLGNAMKDALTKVVAMSNAQGMTGLAGDINSLESSLPQLNSKTAPVAVQLGALDRARSSGISSQTIALFELLGTEHSLDSLIHDSGDLHKQTLALRAPISDLIHSFA